MVCSSWQRLEPSVFARGAQGAAQAGDKAVYIGTVRYTRDEFFEIKKVAIVDDYERANSEFRKKFGTKIALRKALLRRRSSPTPR